MTTPHDWLRIQAELGRQLYLMLDSVGQLEERKALLGELHVHRYDGLYIGTAASALVDAGPYLFQFDSAEHPVINSLIETPERNWGWLASSTCDEVQVVARHWRDRLVSGERPNQALYRFHDNRVVGRALAHMQPEQYAAYLGPIHSLCYWHDNQWTVSENPSPGTQPLPEDPAWLRVPTSSATYAAVQFDNVHRYLMGEHTDRFANVAAQQDVNIWLRNVLDLAHTWGWKEPERLHFLLMQTLQAPGFIPPAAWHPKPNDTPSIHFERVYQEALYWQGAAPQ